MNRLFSIFLNAYKVLGFGSHVPTRKLAARGIEVKSIPID